MQQLEVGVDFYWENGRMVLTETFHRKRGYCCGNRCRHCPYDHANVPKEDDRKSRPTGDAA